MHSYLCFHPLHDYMLFTESRPSPFFDLHVLYRILTFPLFRFTCSLQDLDSSPFSIYMFSTGSCQSPFYVLHVIYRILSVPLFPFTCCLQRLSFSIYIIFTGSSLFNLHVIYVICSLCTLKFTGSSLLFNVSQETFTGFLQDFSEHVKGGKSC